MSSVHLRAGDPHHLLPLLRLGRDVAAKIRRRAADRLGAEPAEALDHLGLLQDPVDLGRQPPTIASGVPRGATSTNHDSAA